MYDNIYIQEKLMFQASNQLISEAERARMIVEAREVAKKERASVQPVHSHNFVGRLLHIATGF